MRRLLLAALSALLPLTLCIGVPLAMHAQEAPLDDTGEATSTPPSDSDLLGNLTPTPTAPSVLMAPGASCGKERWNVKTLSDPDSGLVNLTPQPTTIDELRAIPAPPLGSIQPRIPGVETTTYTVQATLVEFKLETDRDIHLVVADPTSGNTMIVEFPDIGCTGAIGSPEKQDMASARAALVEACGTPITSGFRRLDGAAMLTGVGFFDELHGQDGVAPNGIELHPVLHVQDISCHPASGARLEPTTVPAPLTKDDPTPPTPAPALSSGVTFVSVVGGRPNQYASATVQTTPGATCAIVYITPAGTHSRAKGLEPKTADSSGRVSWLWDIGPSTRPGTGTVSVTCGGASATAPIQIG